MWAWGSMYLIGKVGQIERNHAGATIKAALAKLHSPGSEPQKCSTLQTPRLRPLGTWDFSGAWSLELRPSFRSGPRADRTLPRRFLDRFSSWITQRQQHLFRALRF